MKPTKKLSPARIIALGFGALILLGSGLLMLPCSVQPGQHIRYIDALYTSTSAVCVTGLVVVDSGVAFTPLGRFFLAVLIQIGGLGVSTVGAGIIVIMGRRVNMRGRSLIREGSNLRSGKGVIRFVKQVLLTTLTIELLGAAMSFIIFIKDYPWPEALGYSLFHSVASFNNSGFDILGHSGQLGSNESLFAYHDNVLLNLVTIGLVVFGGMGFLVIQEMRHNKFSWKKYSLHAKVVLSMTAILIVGGAVLIKLTEHAETWLGAFFHSVSTRTAGFSTTSIADFSDAGLLILMVLMFIGASPGSTGGGVKTTTFFALLAGIAAAATNRKEQAFHYALPADAFKKAATIALLALGVVLSGTYLIMVMEPQLQFLDVFFEMVSAFGTVGLSTGITTSLGVGSKLLSILIMYIGRLGPMTVATLWYFSKGERVSRPEGILAIG